MTTTTSPTPPVPESAPTAGSTAAPINGLPPGSRMPAILQLLGLMTRPRAIIEGARRKHGDVFTARLFGMGPYVIPSDPALIRQAFTAPADVLHAGESNQLGPILGKHSLLATDGPEHLRQRRLMLPPFHGARMKDYERMIEEVTLAEIERWPVGEEFAIVPSTMRITVRAILVAVFGAHDEVLERLEVLLPKLTERGSALSAAPFIQRDLGRFSPWGSFLRVRREVDELLDGLIEEAKADEALDARVDVLALLVQARYDDGAPMSNAEIRDQLVTMLAAGHETTANTLGWAVERLRRNPGVLARLVEAVDSGDREYLAATVREVQRVRPVIMFTSRLVKKPFELGGYVLPPGTRLALGGAATHFDPRLFDDPQRFEPQRFLDAKPGTYSWLPFGGGVRRCIGASFAHLEMEVVLRTIVRTYAIVATDMPAEKFKFRGIAYAPAAGGVIQVRRRAAPLAAAERAAEAIAA